MLKKSGNLTSFVVSLGALLVFSSPFASGAAETGAVKTQDAAAGVQAKAVQPSQAAIADVQRMAVIGKSRTAVLPKLNQIASPEFVRFVPAQVTKLQAIQQPELDGRRADTVLGSRSIAALPSQMMKAERVVTNEPPGLVTVLPSQPMKANQFATVEAARSLTVLPSQTMKIDLLADIEASRSITSLRTQTMKADQQAVAEASRSLASSQVQFNPDVVVASSAHAPVMGMILLKNPGSTVSPIRISGERAAKIQRAMRSPLAKWQIKSRLQQ